MRMWGLIIHPTLGAPQAWILLGKRLLPSPAHHLWTFGQPKAWRSGGGLKGHSLHVPVDRNIGSHSSTVSKALGKPFQLSHFCLDVDTSMQTHALGTGPVACLSVWCHLRHPEASETPGQGMQASPASSTQPSLQHLLQGGWDGTANIHTSYRFSSAGRHLKSMSSFS